MATVSRNVFAPHRIRRGDFKPCMRAEAGVKALGPEAIGADITLDASREDRKLALAARASEFEAAACQNGRAGSGSASIALTGVAVDAVLEEVAAHGRIPDEFGL